MITFMIHIIYIINSQTCSIMLEWLLIISITMVSTTMLIFASAFLAILQQSQLYYNVNRSSILLLSNSFNILYLIITPCIFFSLKKHYSLIVNVSVILTAIGCVGRYFCANHFNLSLFMSTLVAIGHIPIITAPYGLLDMFPESHKGYAASIPLFLPVLGINFSIYYGMSFIAGSSAYSEIFDQINILNLIIAILGAGSCFLTLIFMKILKKQIRKINQDNSEKQVNSNNFFSFNLKSEEKLSLALKLAAWGTILGLNWTYGGMFEVFLSSNDLNNKQKALIGLFANISSVLFSNLGNWISNRFNLSNRTIILVLNLSGLIASIIILASTSQSIKSENSQIILIISIIVLRAGFSSFVSLCLVQMGHSGSSVLISSLFFYIANASNLGGNFLVDLFSNSISLAVISLIILLCILTVEFTYFKDMKRNEKQIEILSKQKNVVSDEITETSSLNLQHNLQLVLENQGLEDKRREEL